MKRLEVGKLYSCSKYYLTLYPDRETVASAARRVAGVAARAADAPTAAVAMNAAYLTRELGKPVSFCNPQTLLLVLSVNDKYVEVLAGDHKGWIIYRDWLDIGEIN